MSDTVHISPFEVIRQVSDDGIEYWSARNLAKILGYKEWRNFTTAIEKAKEACEGSGQGVSDHFVGFNKMVQLGSGAQRKTEDLPTPKESIQELQRKEQKRLAQRSQPPLLDDQAATDEI